MTVKGAVVTTKPRRSRRGRGAAAITTETNNNIDALMTPLGGQFPSEHKSGARPGRVPCRAQVARSIIQLIDNLIILSKISSPTHTIWLKFCMRP